MTRDRPMRPAVGFTIARGLDEAARRRQTAARDRALRHFPWLRRATLRHGQTELDVWSHDAPEAALRVDADGRLTLLVGSPAASADAPDDASDDASDAAWEGRWLAVRVSADGCDWSLRTDWVGSIPVFHARVGRGRIASVLEPVVVAAGGFGEGDIDLTGLAALLVNGHYVADETLFQAMRIVGPDREARWLAASFAERPLNTVRASDERFARSWSDLTDEMYETIRAAVERAVPADGQWLLPLSGGLDSRLIAGVARAAGRLLRAYTYGPAGWSECVFARRAARAARIPWKRIALGRDYAARYARLWADWFGSGLHFHGMYQMPFLEALRAEPEGRLIHGYLGDPLAGNHVEALLALHGDEPDGAAAVVMDGDPRWPARELTQLLRVPPRAARDAAEAVRERLRRQMAATDGEPFQRLMLLDLRTRQRLFVSYQPTMYDYWRGVTTPFVDRAYARFCLSLPLEALRGRRLQLDVLRRRFPALATVGGTFRAVPLVPTPAWRMRQALAWRLPRALRVGALREFNPAPNTMGPDCVRRCGRAAVWPIFEARGRLAEWLDWRRIERAFERAAAGSWPAVNRLEAVQAVALRLMQEAPTR